MSTHPETASVPQAQLEPDLAEQSRFQTTLNYCGDIGRNALRGIATGRVMRGALALGVAVGAGTVVGAAAEMAEPGPPRAAAADGGYPDADAAVRDLATYTWWKDENSNGSYDSEEENSSRGYGYRNCTDWVAWRIPQLGVGTVPGGSVMKDAAKWNDNAPSSWVNDGVPEPGDIAQSETTAPYGHVGVVEKVNRNAQGAIISIEVSEYNKSGTGAYTWLTYTPDINGVFWRGSGKKWDLFLDLNGTGKGINNETWPPVTDPDTDADGVNDSKDDCPAKAGTAGYPYYGCPAYLPATSNPALTSELTGNTAISSWGNGRVDLFRRNPDGTVSHKWFDGTSWSSGWDDNLGGEIVGKPGAVSWGWGRIDLFGIGTDNKLKHKYLVDNQTWSDWETLDYLPNDPGCLKEGASASSWGWGRLDIAAEGCDNSVRHLWLNNNQWQPWDNLGGYIVGPPSIASWGPNRVDIFVRGGDNVLYTKLADENGWSGWAGMGGCLSSAPGVTSVGNQRLDVFARGCATNELLHKSFRVNDGAGVWLPWEEWGGNIAESPSAASMNSTRMDVISTGPDGTPQHFYFDRNWPSSGWEGF